MADVTAQSLEAYKPESYNEDGEITCVGSSLVLRTKTAIRHYFELPEGKSIDDYTFVLGEGEDTVILTPGKADGKYYIEISGIPSAELGKEFTLTVLNSENSAVCSRRYSAMSYAYTTLSMFEAGSDSVSAELADTVKALVIYYGAAEEYFRTHP